MRISDLAHLTGVSIRSLRHYEQKGLLRPRRLENSYRDYDEGAIEQVRVIQFYLGLGLNTNEIKRVVNCKGQHIWEGDHTTCADRLIALYEKKMQTIDDEMQVLAEIKARLLGRIRWIQEGKKQVLQEQL